MELNCYLFSIYNIVYMFRWMMKCIAWNNPFLFYRIFSIPIHSIRIRKKKILKWRHALLKMYRGKSTGILFYDGKKCPLPSNHLFNSKGIKYVVHSELHCGLVSRNNFEFEIGFNLQFPWSNIGGSGLSLFTQLRPL